MASKLALLSAKHGSVLPALVAVMLVAGRVGIPGMWDGPL